MGWSSWNKYACNVNETVIKQQADAMVSSGLKDAGYQYINIFNAAGVGPDIDKISVQ